LAADLVAGRDPGETAQILHTILDKIDPRRFTPALSALETGEGRGGKG
jgi:hypothetical protein